MTGNSLSQLLFHSVLEATHWTFLLPILNENSASGRRAPRVQWSESHRGQDAPWGERTLVCREAPGRACLPERTLCPRPSCTIRGGKAKGRSWVLLLLSPEKGYQLKWKGLRASCAAPLHSAYALQTTSPRGSGRREAQALPGQSPTQGIQKNLYGCAVAVQIHQFPGTKSNHLFY